MLGKTINLKRVEVTLNGITRDVYFESQESFEDYVEMFTMKHINDDYEICSHGWCDLQVVGC